MLATVLQLSILCSLLHAHSPHVHLSIIISSPQSLLTYSNFHCISVLFGQQWCILYGSCMQSSCIGWIYKLTVVCVSGPWQGADMNSQRCSAACAWLERPLCSELPMKVKLPWGSSCMVFLLLVARLWMGLRSFPSITDCFWTILSLCSRHIASRAGCAGRI